MSRVRRRFKVINRPATNLLRVITDTQEKHTTNTHPTLCDSIPQASNTFDMHLHGVARLDP